MQIDLRSVSDGSWPPATIRQHPHPGIRELSCGPHARPPFASLQQAIQHWSKCQPDAIAALHGDDCITYAALDQDANQLAAHLSALGVARGDNVGLFVTRSLPMLVAMLAVLKTGAAYVPQDVRITPPDTLRHITGHARCKVLLCQRADAPVVRLLGARQVICIEDSMGHAASSAHCIAPPPGPDANAFILYTSGTTGTPNGVQVTQRNLCNLLLTAPGNLGMRPGLRVSQLLNIAFDMSAWEILGALCNGATLVIRGSSLQHAAAQAEVIIATPSILARLDRDLCPYVRTVAVAGEPCPEALAAHWSQRCEFHNGCGPTETTIVNTLHHYRHDGDGISIGKPTPNNAVYVLDDQLRPCAVGDVGEMWAGGCGVTAGYLEDPVLTAERYRDDPFLGNGWTMFRTRDLGRWNARGELEHLGRTDDQVKVRGFRVELDAVSRVLERTAGVTQAVTLKLDARTLGSAVVPASADAQRARAQAMQHLPYYAVPSRLLAVDSLPLTARGKVDKRRLLQQLSAAPDLMDSIAANESPASAPTPRPAPSTPLPPTLARWRVPFRALSHYNLLFLLVISANLGVAVHYLWEPQWWAALSPSQPSPASLVVINLSAAIVLRQSLVISGLFWLVTRVPVSWPLLLRRDLAKVYHFGGLHVGCASAGVAWLLALTCSAQLGQRSDAAGAPTSALAWTATALLGLLLTMLLLALPALRARHHDVFERAHRYIGWATLPLAWALALQLPTPPAGFVVLGAATFSVMLPWLRLRRVPIEVLRPSRHAAILRLPHTSAPFAGSSNAISLHPLGQWHSFANIPAPGQRGFRLIVSRAGDWTGRFIDDPPRHVWMKGFATAGVAYVEVLFRSVLYVATGSGIGPVLPHLLAKKVPMRLIWSTRSPRATYGDALVDEILAAQPDAVIWDTQLRGQPDLLQLAWETAQEMQAEAVICIANRALTCQVVDGCEARGQAAYGAIWDS